MVRFVIRFIGLVSLVGGICIVAQHRTGHETDAACPIIGGIILLVLFRKKKKRGRSMDAYRARIVANLESMVDDRDWHNDPATDRQKEFADELGIRYSKRETKGSLSAKISAKLGK